MSWAFSCHPMILTPIFFDSKMPSIVRHGIVFRAAFFVGGRKKKKRNTHVMYQLIVRHILNPE